MKIFSMVRKFLGLARRISMGVSWIGLGNLIFSGFILFKTCQAIDLSKKANQIAEQANQIAEQASVQSDLAINWDSKKLEDAYSPLTLHNSFLIFDPPLNYASFDKARMNVIHIINKSEIKASDVKIRIQMIKGPFVICLVALNEKSYPKGSWRVVDYDTKDFRWVNIMIDLMGGKQQAKIILVYSHPGKMLTSKVLESKALQISINSPSQKKTVPVKTFDLYYFD